MRIQASFLHKLTSLFLKYLQSGFFFFIVHGWTVHVYHKITNGFWDQRYKSRFWSKNAFFFYVGEGEGTTLGIKEGVAGAGIWTPDLLATLWLVNHLDWTPGSWSKNALVDRQQKNMRLLESYKHPFSVTDWPLALVRPLC